MQMIGQKFEIQEAQNLERYMNKRLGDTRTKVDPWFRDPNQVFLYAQGQPQPQKQAQAQAQPRAPSGSTIPPSLRKPRVIPPINDAWLWEDSGN
jgi:hypothetical protein